MHQRALWLAFLVAACGGDNAATGPDAAPTPDAPPPFANAFDGDAPQVVTDGGHVLAAPRVQPLFFTGDDAMQAQVEQFLGQLATSDYWTTTTGEYGVGALTILPTMVLTDTPPTTDDALHTLLETKVPAPDASTIYAVFLPTGVTLSTPDGGKSCQDFGAYHDEDVPAGGGSIVYALMPRCPGQGNGDTDLDEVTISTSHELIEAATDPTVETTPAFGDADAAHWTWAVTPGAEVGDFCEYVDTAYAPLVGTFNVQRTWSNAAAKAGHDPCVPAAPGPYIAAEPMLDDTTTIDGYTGAVTTRGVIVPVGMTKTIDVVLYSDVDGAGDFTAQAMDLAGVFGGAAELSFTWDKTSGGNGDHLKLTIRREKAGSLPGSEFVISAQDSTGVTHSLWWSYAN